MTKPLSQLAIIHDEGNLYRIELRALTGTPWMLRQSLKTNIPESIRQPKAPGDQYLLSPAHGEQLRQWAEDIEHRGEAQVKWQMGMSVVKDWVM